MLIKFAVKNYRGFAERIEWVLSSPCNYEFNSSAIKDGVLKNGILWGKNGSGKTNFSLAIFDIVNHLTQKHTEHDYYENFVYAGAPDKPVDFEYTFRFGEQTVFYSYSKSKQGTLINERLVVDKLERFYQSRERKEVVLNQSDFPIDAIKLNDIRDSVNDMSIVNFLWTNFPMSADNYLVKLKQFVDGMLWFRRLELPKYIGFETGVSEIEDFIIAEGLYKDYENFLSDVSDQQFQFVEPIKGDKLLYCRYGDNKIPLIKIASTGTVSLELLYYWIQKMKDATFVFIDEFDAFYHFKLSLNVCKRIFGLDCQVFVSSHNTHLLTNDLLRPDCNFVLQNGSIKPLCELTSKELREANNIEKLYRAGTFDL